MKYLSIGQRTRRCSGDIDIHIADILGQKYRYHIYINVKKLLFYNNV